MLGSAGMVRIKSDDAWRAWHCTVAEGRSPVNDNSAAIAILLVLTYFCCYCWLFLIFNTNDSLRVHKQLGLGH